jgi:hypothetical protein
LLTRLCRVERLLAANDNSRVRLKTRNPPMPSQANGSW